MNNWEKILTPLDKNKKFWTICVIVSVIILIVSTGVNTWNDNVAKNRIVISYICDIVIALSTAILSTFLLNIIYNLSEIHKISRISQVSYESLMPELLQALERFEGRYRKDESVFIKICKYGEDKNEFYKISLEYQYNTNIDKLKELKFKFYRKFNNNINEFTGGLNDSHIDCDFIWGVDERGFPKGIIKDVDYKVSQLVIGGNSVNNIEDYRRVTKLNSITIISYVIPVNKLNNIGTAHQLQISYKVVFPLEREDLLLVTHELPTQNAKITFDFSEIKDEVNIYGLPITGTIVPLAPEEEDEEFRITYLISGWILPKQGYVFGWWKK